VPNTSLRGFNGYRDGLEVAQLADQNDVGVFAKRRAQRVLERFGMSAHFPLIDQTLLVRVHELDRIFDGDDVIRPHPIDVVDHCAEGRRLPRTRGSGDENESLAQHAELKNVRREAELLSGPNLGGDDPEDRSRAFAIEERVGAKTRESLDFVGEIRIVPLCEFLPVALGHDRREQRVEIVGAKRYGRRVERLQVTVFPHDRRRPDRQMQV
jgi:hypothetical protein